MMRDLLSGTPSAVTVAIRDAVLLNAAAALAAETGDFKSALAEAATSLESGAAFAKLNALVEFTR
jgi:anthranilate phosphoribosyltransferase